jgi:hypothetical protein
MLDNPHISRTGNASGRNSHGIDAYVSTPSVKARPGLKVQAGIRAGGIEYRNHTRSLNALQASARRLREAVEAVKRRMAARERLVGR